MNPGASARPSPSIDSAARCCRAGPMEQMRPSQIATSRICPSAPEPSKTFALRMRVSHFTMAAGSNYRLLPLRVGNHISAAHGGPPVAHLESTHGLAAASIASLNKGLGALSGALEPGQVRQLGWNLLREDLSLPSAVLYQDRLLHNLKWMQEFIAAYGVRLAPHGKTTMAPRLFEMQLQSGAWGITLATAHQVQVAHAHGVRRILMANELVGRENMAVISRLLRDPGFEFYCLVDSAAQVEQLGAYFSPQGQRL